MEHLVSLLTLLSFWLVVYSVLAALAAAIQWGQARWSATGIFGNGLWRGRRWGKRG